MRSGSRSSEPVSSGGLCWWSPQRRRNLWLRPQALLKVAGGLGVAWLTACAGPAVARPSPAPVAPLAAPLPPVAVVPSQPPAAVGFGPELLLPDPAAQDGEVARVGDLVLRQSHAFARLTSAHPNLALTAVDLLVFDVLVARHAEQHGVRVDPARVEAVAHDEEQAIRAQVQAELGDATDFAAYVWRIFGMRLEDWQRTLRVRTAQRLYQGYVIRYLALREDRAVVRFLATRELPTAREVVDKVRAGADFGTLALRWSDDPSRRDGGLLPAFGRGFRHPVAQVAFELQKGEVAEPFRARLGDEERWFVVYCLDRLDGRDVPFAVVRDEIDRDLAQNPLTQVETAAYTLRWRGAQERDGRESATSDK